MANEIRYQRFIHDIEPAPSGVVHIFTYSTANAEAIVKSIYVQLVSGFLSGWLRLNGHRIRWYSLIGPISNTTPHAFEVTMRGAVSDYLDFEVVYSNTPVDLRVLVSGVERLDLPAPSSTVEAYRHFREVGTLTPSVTSFPLFTLADPGLGIRRLVKWLDFTLATDGSISSVVGDIKLNGYEFAHIALGNGFQAGPAGSDLRRPWYVDPLNVMEYYAWDGRVLVLEEDDILTLAISAASGSGLSMGWIFSGVDRENQV